MRHMTATALVFLMASAWNAPSLAGVLTVAPDGSGAFPTIQAAIDAAEDGDVVQLLSGTFRGNGNRDVDLLGKAITVESESGNPESCVIDCEEEAIAFLMSQGEGRGTQIRGITIANGRENAVGGISLVATSPTIVSCRFITNVCINGLGGGGIRADASSPLIQDCYFEGNFAGVGGAGVWVALSNGTEILDCTFVGNDAGNSPFVSSGGVYVEDGGYARIERCLFYDNDSSTGPSAVAVVFSSTVEIYSSTIVANQTLGVLISPESDATLESTIVAFNDGAAVLCLGPGGSASLSCCDVFGNASNWTGCLAGQLGQSGNVSADPLFCDEMSWTLEASSPCAPANSGCGLIGAFDVSCGPVPTKAVTWGQLKVRFQK